MSPARLLAAFAAVVVGLVIVLVAVVGGGDDEPTLSIDGGDAVASDADGGPDAAGTEGGVDDDGAGDIDDEAGEDVDLPVTAPKRDDPAAAGPADTSAVDEPDDESETTTTVTLSTTTTVPVTTAAPTTTSPPLAPTDTFPCSFASRQAMLNRLSDLDALDEQSDADLYLRTVARSILEVGQVLTEDERVTDLENAFDAFRSFPGGCPDVIDQAFANGDRFLCRASQISVDERIHDYLVRAVGSQMDGCTYPEIDG